MTTYTLTVTHEPDRPDRPDQRRLLATHTVDNPTAMIDTHLQAMVDHAAAGPVRLHWTSDDPAFVSILVIDLSTLTQVQAAQTIADEGRDLAAMYWHEYHATRWEPSVHTPNPATH